MRAIPRNVIFGIGFTITFLFSIVILIVCFTYKNSVPLEELTWWQTGIIYQIYPRSFKDDSGDGIGDIKGITSKSSYFPSLGVQILWICPMYPSPMKDFGYDISDYKDIDPMFGNLADFDEMVETMHDEGIKVVMDFVPNHSSDQHEWFIKSAERDPKYFDYYIWKSCNKSQEPGTPPNNWKSAFGGSAWEWHEGRQEFYMHDFLKEQPDLNYRNPDVVEEMQNVLRFWMDRGVDGFRIDALKFLVEVDSICGKDEPVNQNSGQNDSTQYDYLEHIYTTNQPETFEILQEWREVLDEYEDKFMMVEIYDETIDNTMLYYGTDGNILSDFPFNFFIINNFQERSSVTGVKLKETIDTWMTHMPYGMWPNWVLGSHDTGRISSRLAPDIIDAMNMVSLLLPGTPVTYYGEEIGMQDTYISYEDTQDPSGCAQGPDDYDLYSRDPERTPMQWDNTTFAGFTNGTSTWLPVNENYKTLNVLFETYSSDQTSYKVYRDLASIRTRDAFREGTLEFPYVTEQIFSFTRTSETNEESFLVVINAAVEPLENVDLTASGADLPSKGKVAIRSSTDSRSITQPGSEMDLSDLSLLGGEGILFRL